MFNELRFNWDLAKQNEAFAKEFDRFRILKNSFQSIG